MKKAEHTREFEETRKYYKGSGDVVRAWKTSFGAEIKTANTSFRITFLAGDAVRVEETRLKENASLIDLSAFELTSFSYSENDESITLAAEELIVVAGKKPFSIAFYDNQGTRLTKDENEAAVYCGNFVRSVKSGSGDEYIYGLGEKTGFLNKKGEKLTMWNTDIFDPHVHSTDPLYASVPFYISLNGDGAYGIYYNNAYRSVFDFRNADRHICEFEGGNLDYFFFYGPKIDKIIGRYTHLTGRTPLPPLYALGYQQSRYSYYPDEKVLEVAETLRKKKIPCDVIYLDIHYMDEFKVFTVDESGFKDFKGLNEKLMAMGFKTVVTENPGLKKDSSYPVFREAAAENYLLKYIDGLTYYGEVWPGISAFPDFYREDVRKWWRKLQKIYLDLAVSGIWNDMNEPAIFNETKTMEEDIVHGTAGDIRLHREIHNLYGSLVNKATMDGIMAEKPNERPFVLTRAAFAGGQKYAAVWTGDNRSFYEHLAMSIPMCLNLGLSGFAFCGCDTGGFSDDCSAELLARWTACACLFPFFRNHSGFATRHQEPYAYDEKTLDICRKFINLRYSLLPYIYDLFRQSAETGCPIIRPLVYSYQSDREVREIYDEFMLGESILAAPILKPGSKYREVYIPKGTWINYFTGEFLEGGRTILAYAPLDTMPLYVRCTSIIPLAEPMLSTEDMNRDTLTLNVYAGDNGCEYIHTTDDGISLDYTRGVYTKIKFSLNISENDVIISMQTLKNGYKSYERVKVKAYIKKEKRPVVMQEDRGELLSLYNMQENSVSFTAEVIENGFNVTIKF